ncbi:ubiquinol oxidase 3, mitochondrial-like [Impatiens glandulifera]|uniref:ubiquinol oxidase 3, mitochondrial-like n=1 Tax=Impatiens glandulifera TaxID=253017 RepID=UPI001FB160F0|nr:ubiquinol oxidase 3, mitochondrial-like [Impatiens glandulifera]
MLANNRNAINKLSGLLLRQQLISRQFSSNPTIALVGGAANKSSSIPATRITVLGSRSFSSSGGTPADGKDDEQKKTDGKVISSYWGIAPPKMTKEDGSPWKWNCFRPWESYNPDVSIDVKKHHSADNFTDKFAYWAVQVAKYPTYLFFQRRHMCHALLLETVAAVPGMVGGMLLHCKSLRRFEHSGGWIKALLEEAENERMHLMTFIELSKPKWYERALVFAAQGVFFNAYFVTYLASPKIAHRIAGYLEEEAVNSYTEFLKDIDNGKFENIPAPAIAIDYWRLPADATLRDVVVVIRADECHHRDTNHFAADIHVQGHELKDFPAPLDFH